MRPAVMQEKAVEAPGLDLEEEVKAEGRGDSLTLARISKTACTRQLTHLVSCNWRGKSERTRKVGSLGLGGTHCAV